MAETEKKTIPGPNKDPMSSPPRTLPDAGRIDQAAKVLKWNREREMQPTSPLEPVQKRPGAGAP